MAQPVGAAAVEKFWLAQTGSEGTCLASKLAVRLVVYGIAQQVDEGELGHWKAVLLKLAQGGLYLQVTDWQHDL